MKWIILSPHLDDAVYSCGGFIWDLTNAGQEVEVWTICGSDPPPGPLSPFAASLHSDWDLSANAYQVRRQEDQDALQILGAKPRYLSYLDCIYRQSIVNEYYYVNEIAIFGGLDAREIGLINQLSAELLSELPTDARIIAPLGIGNHVDHELTRKAANRLSRTVFYYADYPYARESEGREILRFLNSSDDWSAEIFPVSSEGFFKWIQASRSYESQFSIFWENEAALENDIRHFGEIMGGMKLWKTIPEE